MADTPERDGTREELARRLERARRDADAFRERLARLSAVERFRTLSDSERALITEWREQATRVAAEIRDLEQAIGTGR